MRLSVKLPAMIAMGAIATAILISANDYYAAINVVERQVTENLKNVRNGRKAEVLRFLSRVHEDLELLASGNQVRTALGDFSSQFQRIERQGENRAQYMQHLYNENVPTGTLGSTIVRDPAIIAYGAQHEIHDSWFRHIVPVRGYGDLYLISHQGDVVYSVLKKDDFASNLAKGRWHDTGLAKVFRGAMSKAGVAPPPNEMPSKMAGMAHGAATQPMGHGGHGVKPRIDQSLAHGSEMTPNMPKGDHAQHGGMAKQPPPDDTGNHTGHGTSHGKLHSGLDHTAHNRELFQDIAQYLPDHGAPAGFMAIPVIDFNGHAAGVLAVRFPIDRVNTIMQEASNLGRTGDAFLVGSDHLFRSQPRFGTGSFVIRKMAEGQVIGSALRGEEGVQETVSYNGRKVLAAYGALEFHGTRWAIISELDLDEIHAPTEEMRQRMILVGTALTTLLVLIGIFMTRTVTAPLSRVSDALNDFAETRTATEVPDVSRNDEIGDIARNFDATAREISSYIDGINEAREELKQGEKEIRDREERIRSLLEVSPLGFILARPSGEILFTNDAIRKILRINDDEPVTYDAKKLYQNPDDRKEYLKTLQNEGSVSGYELVWQHADGSPFWVTLSAKIIDYEGESAVLAWIDDVTERKRAEKEISENAEKSRSITETASDAIIVIDETEAIISWNAAAERLFGYSTEEMIGQRVDKIVPPANREAHKRGLANAANGNVGSLLGTTTEITALRADGSVFPIDISLSEWTAGEKKHFTAFIRDITERKEAAVELAAKEAQLRMAMENMPGGMVMIGKDLSIGPFNNKAHEIFNLPKELYVEGNSILDVRRFQAERGDFDMIDEAHLRADTTKLFASGQSTQYERLLSNGRWVEVVTEPSPDGGSILVAMDVTERKLAEEILEDERQSLQLLHETSKAIQMASDLDQVYAACLENICVHMDWNVSHVYIVDAQSQTSIVSSKVWYFDDEEPFKAFRDATEENYFETGKGLPLRALETRKPTWISEKRNTPRAAAARDAGIVSGFAFPIIFGKRVIAVIECFSQNPIERNDRLLSLLESVGNQLGGAIVRKTAELEVAEQRAITQTVLNTMDQGILMVDGERNIVIANDRFAELQKLETDWRQSFQTFDQMITHVFESVRDEDDADAMIDQAIDMVQSQKASTVELGFPGNRFVEVRQNPLDAGGVVRTYTDTTERKNAEQVISDAMALINGSIQYASRIQRSILPNDSILSAVTNDHFIIWEPRDVVGGDIYWHGAWGNGCLIILGDCTGHGVPGAFMTLISIGALERAMSEVDGGDVGKLVTRMHQYIQVTLGQHYSGGDSDDGIELGACYFVPEVPEMKFVGARFEVFINNGDEINVIKGTKKGMGYRKVSYTQEYDEHVIRVMPGDRLYLTTDGYTDQVGGDNRRMFGKKRLKELLTSMQDQPMAAQKELLMDALEVYQGDEVRRDDVSIIGFKM